MVATINATDDGQDSALGYAIMCVDRNIHDLDQTWITMNKSGLTDPEILTQVEDSINFAKQSRSILIAMYEGITGVNYG
jgi:hypothetical protein